MDIDDQQIGSCVPRTKPICQRRCLVCKKLPSTSDGISLHRFPNRSTDNKRFRAWCIACNLSKDPSLSSVLCSDHFSIDQFYVMKRSDQSRLLLVTSAIPNVNLPGGPRAEYVERRVSEEKILGLNTSKIPRYSPQPPNSERDRELDEELYVCVTVVRK